MNVSRIGEKYHCNICGNEVAVTVVGGGELFCCSEPMELIEEGGEALEEEEIEEE